MFNLMPKDMHFFDLFEDLAKHVLKSAQLLEELTRSLPNGAGVIQRIRQVEHEADDLAHQALDRLDRSFITPFDREDIHELVGGLDDIIDEIDAVAKRFPLYHVSSAEQAFCNQAKTLIEATSVVVRAVERLRKTRRLSEFSQDLIELHRLENVGDETNHAAVSKLYEGNVDALSVIKWKELYDRIEKAIDRCEDVGNTLERIMLKNG